MTSRDRDYEPLLAKGDGDDEYDNGVSRDSTYPPSSSPPPHYAPPTGTSLTIRALLNRPSLFFAFSCLLAIALSAVNLSVLSAADSFNTYTTEQSPKRHPSVYAGLEKIKWDTNRCRNRTAYPTEYATSEGNDIAGRKRIHAPRDEVMFSFGGKTAAHVTFYIPDYALETCVLNFVAAYPTATVMSGYDSSASVGGRDDHSHGGPSTSGGTKKEPVMVTRPDYMNSTTSTTITAQSTFDVFVLQSPEKLQGRQQLPAISLGPLVGKDGQVFSKPFTCKAQSRIAVLVSCPDNCRWEFGLQGMTIHSSSGKSSIKTGFRLQQYEGSECIKE